MKQLEILTLPVGQMRTNCYLLRDESSRDTIILDPGDDASYIENVISDHDLVPKVIIATHGHFDHLMAALELEFAYKIPFLINQQDLFLVKQMRSSAKHWLEIDPGPAPQITVGLKNDERLILGKTKLKIIETPGHTPGSISLYEKNAGVIFVGDLIFAGGGVGRTDFSYSEKFRLEKSVKNVLGFADKTVVYPGHGESFTIEEFKKCKR